LAEVTVPPAVLVLAGGRATRMGGGDKALLPFGEATLLDQVLDRMVAQGSGTLLSANGDPARFARFGLPVLADPLPDHPGPLAGVLAGLEWLRDQAPTATDLVTVPTDTPFLPLDLVARLVAAREGEHADLACAASGGRLHPVIGLWPVRLAAALRVALAEEGLRRVGEFAARFRRVSVAYETDPIDPFVNVNTPLELAEAERIWLGVQSGSVSPRAGATP
jgi:molybdopterin-guanine dinucleotide biosynthesis protein A